MGGAPAYCTRARCGDDRSNEGRTFGCGRGREKEGGELKLLKRELRHFRDGVSTFNDSASKSESSGGGKSETAKKSGEE